jgi:geranylgeranyl diphosphate synthase type II
MVDFKKAQDIINHEISVIEFNREPGELYDPVNYILSIGGKRIRPSLVIMACSLFSDQITHAIKPALALEIFHNFTLLHDDMMDNSVLRRNKPTVHEKWNRNIAILSGDVMSIIAYKYISDCPSGILPSILGLFTETAIKVCEGQQYDLNFETRNDVSVHEYLKMIELKTAVLIAASLKIGAILGGASLADADLLYEFGKNLGITFQLMDDILDVYGETDKFGKRIGTDIVANKKTFLVLKAIEVADDRTRSQLTELMSSSDFDPGEKINRVINIFNKLGIKEITQEKSGEYYDHALKTLDMVSVNQERKRTLKEFAKMLIEREH